MADEKSPQAPKSLGSDLDKKNLLLLGLNLLNKGLKLPYAVVRPQAKPPAPKPTSELAEKLKSSTSPPMSPLKTMQPTAVSLEGNRKRKRDPANDISEVERREKRKMMNRVSAQNARDRKKAYVEDLERKIAILEEKNKKLEEENTQLKQHTSTLSQEKEQLEQKLSSGTAESDMLQALVKEALLQEPHAQGSAVPQHVSLQQKQFLRPWLLLQIFLTFSLNCSPTSLKSSSQQRLFQLLLESLEEQEAMVPVLQQNHLPLLRESPWWGTAHSNWNPPKN